MAFEIKIHLVQSSLVVKMVKISDAIVIESWLFSPDFKLFFSKKHLKSRIQINNLTLNNIYTNQNGNSWQREFKNNLGIKITLNLDNIGYVCYSLQHLFKKIT